MAPRARSTRSAASRGSNAKSSQRQSSLTFNNSRVTKPSAATTSTKDKKAAADAEAKAAKLLQETEEQASTQGDAVEVKPDDDDIEAEVEKEGLEEKTGASIPIRSQIPGKVIGGPEAAAQKISETQIRKYWKEKEAERKTPRVHQEGLSLHEKVLREFDMSYQYGPCIGITRTRRWNRAENLGLKPPIEVLAVLLKEDESQKDGKFERAYMDKLANSRLGVVV